MKLFAKHRRLFLLLFLLTVSTAFALGILRVLEVEKPPVTVEFCRQVFFDFCMNCHSASHSWTNMSVDACNITKNESVARCFANTTISNKLGLYPNVDVRSICPMSIIP